MILSDNILVRPAKEEDLSDILSLVRALALYEKAPDEVVVSIDDYVRDWRADRFESIVALKDDKVVGMCLYFMAYSSWKGAILYLDDFVVTPSERGNGIGQLLFDEILAIAKKRDVALLKWQVLDWNEPALNFYKKYGAVIEKEWWNGKIVMRDEK